MEFLKTKIISTTHAPHQNCIYIAGTNEAVQNYNLKKLEHLDTPEVINVASNILPHGVIEHIDKSGRILSTPFLNKLVLKKGARIMLTYNVDTKDGLTNGTFGTVHAFLKDVTGALTTVYVIFDKESDGSALRQTKGHQVTEDGKLATPISKIEFSYVIGKQIRNRIAKAITIQFPLTLAWAATVHKCQGLTIKKPTALIADLGTIFADNQAYVLLTRIQNSQQLYISSFNIARKPFTKILKCSKQALNEAVDMKKRSINFKSDPWNDSNDLKITLLNIRSLRNKIQPDLMNDPKVMQSNIIALTETSLNPDEQMSLQGYKAAHANAGLGKGVTVFHQNIQFRSIMTYNENNTQAVFLQNELISILVLYRNQNCTPFELQAALITNMRDLENPPTLIIGKLHLYAKKTEIYISSPSKSVLNQIY